MTDQKAGNSILYTVLISQFTMPFMFSGTAVTLPIMGRDMNAGGVALSLVEIVFLGAAGAFLIPFGKLADMTNKQAVYKAGLLFTFFVTLILGFIPTIEMFIFFRLVQGLAFAMLGATGMAILTETQPKAHLGKALGLSVGAVYTGLTAGPFVGGIVTEHMGWRWIYFITSFILLLANIQSVRYLKGKWSKPTEHFDFLGSLILIAILTFWIIGSSKLNQGTTGITLLVVGLILVPFFVFIEQKIKTPLFEFSFFRSHANFSKALLIQLLAYAGTFGVTFLFSLYLQTAKQFSPRNTGLLLMISPVLMATLAPIFGRLSDRFNPRKLATYGVFFMFVSTMLAVWITVEISIYWLCMVLVFQGIGFAMFSSPNMKIIMTSVDRTRTSLAAALASEMRSLGMIISMMLITLFMSLVMGQTLISTATANRYINVMHYSLIAFSILAGMALVLSFLSQDRKI